MFWYPAQAGGVELVRAGYMVYRNSPFKPRDRRTRGLGAGGAPAGAGPPHGPEMDPAGKSERRTGDPMKLRIRAAVAGVATLLLVSTSFAASTMQPSTLALGRTDIDVVSRGPVLALTAPAPLELAAVRYDPAQPVRYDTPGGQRPIVSQLHGGYFNGSANNTDPFIVGLRVGPQVDKRLQVGVMVDWIHQTKTLSNILSTSQAPGAIEVSTKQDTARALMNLVPIMGFVQASGWGLLGFVPYIGAAGGYELLVLSADNFLNGQSFEANFGGWGYQIWTGVGLPLGNRTKLSGELFVNEATLSKTVTDAATGVSARQTVDMNGIGFRLGIAWGYAPKNPQ